MYLWVIVFITISWLSFLLYCIFNMFSNLVIIALICWNYCIQNPETYISFIKFCSEEFIILLFDLLFCLFSCCQHSNVPRINATQQRTSPEEIGLIFRNLSWETEVNTKKQHYCSHINKAETLHSVLAPVV